ncbi:HAMP domain-containing sensor histidine kinase [Aeromicrobium sp. Root236]|uniref:sensor histidine kinase n=1 Tax=Aeromicrobium sp. Root236 TaxID=1736498 RepID=UPI0009E73901|nr:HAMP domain-containing sensor histidine kinase [Aeromicrobium sp. Root236]
MSESEASKLLNSSAASARLQGARLALGDTSLTLAKLRAFRDQESNSWVRIALGRAISARRPDGDVQIGEAWISLPDEIDRNDVRAEAIQAVTRTIIHEARPIVLDVHLAAARDIGESYESSDTRQRLERLSEFLDTLTRLHDAAAPPQFRETDLADLVVEEISQMGYADGVVRAARSEPVVVQCDQGLLSLALQNAIRNAVEATLPVVGPPVVVAFGADNDQAWVTVLDEGKGLPDGANRIWEPGISAGKSKDKHFGFGLPIAELAVHSLGGTIELRPREDRGTACEIRWALPKVVTGEDSSSRG